MINTHAQQQNKQTKKTSACHESHTYSGQKEEIRLSFLEKRMRISTQKCITKNITCFECLLGIVVNRFKRTNFEKKKNPLDQNIVQMQWRCLQP